VGDRRRGSRGAAELWTRAELRARWRSWLVLGVLAGATAGLAAAGVAGARRTEQALPRFIAAAPRVDAAVLPNDVAFDARQRAAVARLPEVEQTMPFWVPILLQVAKPSGLDSALLPRNLAMSRTAESVLVAGRHTNPRRPDEAVIDQNIARHYGLGLGSTLVVTQEIAPDAASHAPPGLFTPGARSFRQALRVVGISKSVSSDESWSPSLGLDAKYHDAVVGFTNMFVRLHGGEARFDAFARDVQRIVGHPVNVERASDILGTRQLKNVMDVERDGLLLFALAVVLGGGVLVGQALVRAVTAAGADLDTWRAIGADRRLSVRGMIGAASVTIISAGAVAIAVAIALSPRFPIGLARRFELDVGVHTDWLVIAGAVALVALAITGIAAAAAWWRVTRGEREVTPTSRTARWAAAAGMPPALLVGSRLAVEPGRGRRAVPVRSALIGAIVGVLGVVACFTFRDGINDAAATPQRSGVVWSYQVAAGGSTIAPRARAQLVHDPAVATATRALWARALPIDGVGTPTFGIADLRGRMPFVVLSGRAPRGTSEIAFAPTTMKALGVQIGDHVRVGTGGHRARVVGEALLPASSHTDYDQSGWMTLAGMRAALGPGAVSARPDDFEDYLLLRFRPGADVGAAERRIAKISAGAEYFTQPAVLPPAVVDLGHLGTMPLVLAIFFGLLGCATVAHALVTTVRRRRYDLAVLRAMGFSRRQSRLAIAWQATILAVLGLLVGVPLGIVLGRTVWRWVAEDFPVLYVPPIEVLVILVVVPVVLLVAQALAAGPAHAATRIQPAQTLRTE
jgi:hypothetical protein